MGLNCSVRRENPKCVKLGELILLINDVRSCRKAPFLLEKEALDGKPGGRVC